MVLKTCKSDSSSKITVPNQLTEVRPGTPESTWTDTAYTWARRRQPPQNLPSHCFTSRDSSLRNDRVNVRLLRSELNVAHFGWSNGPREWRASPMVPGGRIRPWRGRDRHGTLTHSQPGWKLRILTYFITKYQISLQISFLYIYIVVRAKWLMINEVTLWWLIYLPYAT